MKKTMKRHLTSLCLLLAALVAPLATSAKKTKKYKEPRIESVEKIQVQCAVGTVPALPWQVLVTYNNQYKEWRQTRWTHAASTTEQQMADPRLNPVGKKYTVTGFVLGDNSTDQGYPIQAEVTVVESTPVPSTRPVAHPLPLKDVKLLGQNRFTNNRNLDVENLLSINYKQMLYNYRDTYGLPTEGYPEADGWDSPTTKLKGHGTGHYLSALAFAYATEPDATDASQGSTPNRKARLLDTLRKMVDEMRACQERTFVYDEKLGRYREARDYAPEAELKQMKGSWKDFDNYKKDYAHYGYGYLNAIPAAHPALIEMYRAYNNEEWVWAPYYTIHKQLAGLIDIANNVDDKEVADKALLIAKDMGLWVWNRLHYRTYASSEGDKAQRQAKPGNRYEMWNMYIAGEVGGMQESLARLSRMVTDATDSQRLLEAASYFDSPAFYDPLSRNIDDIRTRHANQHIPMITGALHTFMANGNPYYYHIANNFWNLIQGRYVYAMGGVGNGEMFRQPYSQMLSMNTNVMSDRRRNMHPNPDLNETCCAYNLAKLTKDLNMLDPDDARYMDYYERVLVNQILGSVHPDHFACTYQYAVGMNAVKPYGNETPQSSCCGGTGAENHVKYQEAAYFVNDKTMWVALYMPTQAYWAEKDVYVTQDFNWPDQKITFRIHNAKAGNKARFAMKLRIPYWANSLNNKIVLNGQKLAGAAYGQPVKKASYSASVLTNDAKPCTYFEIPEREWADDDVLEVSLPYTSHISFGPDKMEVAAVEGNSSKSFAPAWLGAMMYGPLVMATDGVKEWGDEVLDVHADYSNAYIWEYTDQKTDGTGGQLYTMSLEEVPNWNINWDVPAPQRINLTPDYFQTERSTHYLRLNILGSEPANEKEMRKINHELLLTALETAHQRQNEQEAWNALSVKVPEYAPWAPYGYARFVNKMAEAEKTAQNKKAQPTEVKQALTALNVAINTMRPGNLAEPEDLAELLPMVTEAKNVANKSTELREAIQYADMVVQYVNDGSGTHDLIKKAVKRLREVGN